MSMVSVSSYLKENDQVQARMTKLFRKSTHTLSSLLFFAYTWQTIIFLTVLRPFYENKRNEANTNVAFIELN